MEEYPHRFNKDFDERITKAEKTILDKIDDKTNEFKQDYFIDYEGLLKTFKKGDKEDPDDAIIIDDDDDLEIRTRINYDGEDDDDDSSTVIAGIQLNNIKYFYVK